MTDTYEDVKRRTFATGRAIDGYNGDTMPVEFALLTTNEIAIVHDCGYYRAPIMPVRNQEIALHLLREMPACKAFLIDVQPK